MSAERFLYAIKKLFADAIFLYNHHDASTPDKYRSDRKNIIKRF